MTRPDFAQPCDHCADAQHDQCADICGCLADHDGDAPMIVGFKRLKRQMHPDREAWVKGGWRRLPIRVIAEVGSRRDDLR